LSCDSGVWPLSFEKKYILNCSFCRSNLYGFKPGYGPVLGKTLSVWFHKSVIVAVLTL